MDRVKAAAVVELDGQITEKRGEIEHLESETASSLWSSDLEEFREAWTTYVQERVASNTAVTQSDKKGKKRPTIGKK
jgi:hypothetical protein